MVQAVEIALSTRRFHWQIYTPNFGTIYDDLPGREFGLVCGEIRRRTLDALSADDRITGVEDFKFRQDGESVTASFMVKTVFGDVRQEVTV